MTNRFVVVCSLVVATAVANAQQPTGQGRTTIAGTVFDSLITNAVLPGAEVTIDGTVYTATTDAKGRFRIEGVNAGRAVVRFYHASLDSLGFGAPPIAVTVPDSGTVSVRLATPSPVRLRTALCPGAQATSTGVVLGRVRNVDDKSPLADAKVTASWSEWSIGKNGLVRSERRATAAGTASGSFALCGVPNDVAVVVRASAGGHTTGLSEVDLSQRLFVVRDFGVSLADSGSTSDELARLDSAFARGDSIALRGGATITGVVHGSHGRIITQAQVGLLGFPIAVRTGSEGQFALTRVPSGTQTLDIRALGFAPQRLTLDLTSGERRTLDLTLDDAKAQDLAPVNIVGRGTTLDRSGFEDRSKAGFGRFITADEIKRRGVFDTQQALWNVSGARVSWNGFENVLTFTRQSGAVAPMRSGSGFDDVAFSGTSPRCLPIYWIDGDYFGDIGADIDRMVRPYQIRGIEAYVNPGSAPPRYRQGHDQCGIVLIWTNLRPKELKQPGR